MQIIVYGVLKLNIKKAVFVPSFWIDIFVKKCLCLSKSPILIKHIQGNKYIPLFRITEEGIKAFQDHRFQNLAATSYSNYQSYETNSILLKISKRSLIISRKSLMIDVISLVIVVVAIMASIA